MDYLYSFKVSIEEELLSNLLSLKWPPLKKKQVSTLLGVKWCTDKFVRRYSRNLPIDDSLTL